MIERAVDQARFYLPSNNCRNAACDYTGRVELLETALANLFAMDAETGSHPKRAAQESAVQASPSQR